MQFLPTLLESAPPATYAEALGGLTSGQLMPVILRRTEYEVTARVNTAGRTYRVFICEARALCSCLWENPCPHILAAALVGLGQGDPEVIHLSRDGYPLCHDPNPRRIWCNWTLNAKNWTDIVCQSCAHIWLHPLPLA